MAKPYLGDYFGFDDIIENLFAIKILPELQLQNLDHPYAQSQNKSLALGPNVSSQICNKLLPT